MWRSVQIFFYYHRVCATRRLCNYRQQFTIPPPLPKKNTTKQYIYPLAFSAYCIMSWTWNGSKNSTPLSLTTKWGRKYDFCKDVVKYFGYRIFYPPVYIAVSWFYTVSVSSLAHLVVYIFLSILLSIMRKLDAHNHPFYHPASIFLSILSIVYCLLSYISYCLPSCRSFVCHFCGGSLFAHDHFVYPLVNPLSPPVSILYIITFCLFSSLPSCLSFCPVFCGICLSMTTLYILGGMVAQFWKAW